MKLTPSDVVSVVNGPSLEFIPLRAAGAQGHAAAGRFSGTIGSGYTSALVWRIAVRVEGEPGTWVGRHRRPNRRDPLVCRTPTSTCGSRAGSTRSPTIRSVRTAANSPTTRCPSRTSRWAPCRRRRARWVSSIARPRTRSRRRRSPASTSRSSTAAARSRRRCRCAADLNLGVSGGTDCTVPARLERGEHPRRAQQLLSSEPHRGARADVAPLGLLADEPAPRQRQHHRDVQRRVGRRRRQLLQVRRRLQQHRRARGRVPPRVGARSGPKRRRRLRQPVRGVRRHHVVHADARLLRRARLQAVRGVAAATATPA